MSDLISRQAAIDALQKEINKGIPPFDDVMGSIRCGVRLARNIIEDLPSAQPERTCVNCGKTINNGGWYADGRTRCPIEEHYALPKDGYCHLWEKRNVTDDDYPERRTESQYFETENSSEKPNNCETCRWFEEYTNFCYSKADSDDHACHYEPKEQTERSSE